MKAQELICNGPHPKIEVQPHRWSSPSRTTLVTVWEGVQCPEHDGLPFHEGPPQN